ncbi:MAG TPA: MFS transporter [Polyangiaceae bacterium]|nr:MFS transporter [Polyangiaceae bacterium]
MNGAPSERSALAGGAVAALLLACAQAPLGSTMIAVAIPSIAKTLSEDVATATSLLVTSYLVVNIVGQSPGGKLGDVLGHSRTVRFGMVMYALGSLAGLVANRLSILVVSRATMALGGALVVPATMALLRVHVPAERRGRVFGLVGATMGLSAAIGPPLGGEIVTRFGWRGIFAASLPFLAVAAVLSRIFRLPRREGGDEGKAKEGLRRFDYVGSALFAVALGALVVASKVAPSRRLSMLAASLAVLVGFVLWELRAKDPVLDVRLFAIRGFATGSLGVTFQNFAMYGLIFQLPQFFTGLRGATARDVGRILFVMMLGMFLTSMLGGRLSDRWGARRIALAAQIPFLAGFGLLTRIPEFQTPKDAAPALLLLGVGLGLSGAPFQATAMTSVSAARSGMAAGGTSTMRYAGGVVSILLLGVVLGEGGHATIENHLAAVRVFLVGGVLSAITAALLPGRTAHGRAA